MASGAMTVSPRAMVPFRYLKPPEEFNAGVIGSLRMNFCERAKDGSSYPHLQLTTPLQYHCDIQRGCAARAIPDQARLVSEGLSA